MTKDEAQKKVDLVARMINDLSELIGGIIIATNNDGDVWVYAKYDDNGTIKYVHSKEIN